MRGTLSEVTNTMGNPPIDPINPQNSELISSMELERECRSGATIEAISNILPPNSNVTTSIEGQKFIGTLPIARIDGHLSSNIAPPHKVVELSPIPKLANLASSIDMETPTLKYAAINTTSMPIQLANSSTTLTSNFEPPQRVSIKIDHAASKLGNGSQTRTKLRAKPSVPPSRVAGASQSP